MMKTKNKIIGLVMVAVLLVTASVFGTMAYLTSQDVVVNTFTVGSVDIKLDEAKVYEDGSLADEGGRVKENNYKLIPGHTYVKDPRVTVLAGSEESYIRMIVTISKAKELDAIFDPDGAELMNIFDEYNPDNWKLVNSTGTRESVNNTISYEFRYKEVVAAPDADLELDELFEKIIVPGTITKEQLASIEGMTITVVAHAIQADGFTSEEAAWAAFTY